MINFLSKVAAAAETNNWGLSLVTTEGKTNITDLMDVVVSWVSLIGGIMAFIYLVYSGILYLTAAGNPDAAKKGQQGIINAVIGIIIIIAAYTIVKVIANQAKTGLTT